MLSVLQMQLLVVSLLDKMKASSEAVIEVFIFKQVALEVTHV